MPALRHGWVACTWPRWMPAATHDPNELVASFATRDHAMSYEGFVMLDTEKHVVIRTAGDLWKGLGEARMLDPGSWEGRKPLQEVLGKLNEMVREPPDTLAEAMRRLIAKVAITMNVDRTHVINMEFVEFSSHVKAPLYPEAGWGAH